MKKKVNIIEVVEASAVISNIVYPANTIITFYNDTSKVKVGDGKTKFNDLAEIGGSSGGELPTGQYRDSLFYNQDNQLVADRLGWAQFSDLPTPPPFSNGFLTGTAFQINGGALWGIIEWALGEDSQSVVKPNAVPAYNPGIIGSGGGTIPVADAINDVDAVNLKQLKLKANLASPAFTGTPTGITKAHVGLSNVDNTTDLLKPVSTATQTALNAKLTATTAAFNAKLTATIAATQANSTATDVAGLVADFNALLAKLKSAGIMTP